MMRVLHIIDHLGPGGAQTALLNLLKFRDSSRFDCTIASMHGQGQMAAEFSALGLRVISLSPSKWPPLYLVSLWRLLRSERFDVVHCHLFGANWVARPLARLLGCRVIFTHDQCNDAMREKFLFRAIDAFTNAFAVRVLAVSRSTVDFLVQREGLSPGQVEYFPNGIDVRAFTPTSPEARLAARQKWSLSEQDTIVGGVGRLVPQKDFAVFLDAAAIILRDHRNIRFVIFGDGPEEAALKARVASLGITDRVIFAGYVDERTAIYQAIDVMFLTSRYEGTPMVLLEAMAAGVPIAASGVDGTAEILRDGISAALFPPSDPSAAARALIGLLDDPVRASALATSARETVHSDFDARTLMLRLESLYLYACGIKMPENLDVAENSQADTTGAR